MNCSEAQELFGIAWDLPQNDPRSHMLMEHLATCSACAEEFQVWEASREIFFDLDMEELQDQAEEVNRAVMDRIYRESPWLIPDQSKPFAISDKVRKHLSIWITCCVFVFLLSMSYFMVGDQFWGEEKVQNNTGILPTGIAGTPSLVPEYELTHITSVNSGIIEPFVVGMSPTHPQYWMILSIVSVALALFSLRRLNRNRH